jgi:hypothetical protein
MRGALPKPKAQRIAEGNPSRRPLPNEPNHVAGVPAIPKRASRESRAVYGELTGAMDPRMLCLTDRRALWELAEDEALLAQAYDGFWKMAKALGRKAKAEGKQLPAGEVMTLMSTNNGRNAMACLRDLASRVIIERREFGLTPSARVRIAMSKRMDSDNAVDDAIFNRPAQLLLLPKSG